MLSFYDFIDEFGYESFFSTDGFLLWGFFIYELFLEWIADYKNDSFVKVDNLVKFFKSVSTFYAAIEF